MFSFVLIHLTSLLSMTMSRYVTVSPPLTGIELGSPDNGYSILFPLAVSQCEPVSIFYDVDPAAAVIDYNRTVADDDGVTYLATDLAIRTPDPDSELLAKISVPIGSGFLEWICNIPAGQSFVAEVNSSRHYIVEKLSSSTSSCLHEVTNTFSLITYFTPEFDAFTKYPPEDVSAPLATSATITSSYPSGPFVTTTINLDENTTTTSSFFTRPPSFSTTPTIALPPSSTVLDLVPSSPTPSASTSSGKRINTSAIVGGVSGGFCLIILIACLVILHKRPNPRPTDFPQTVPIFPALIRTPESPPMRRSVINLNYPTSRPSTSIPYLPDREETSLLSHPASPVSATGDHVTELPANSCLGLDTDPVLVPDNRRAPIPTSESMNLLSVVVDALSYPEADEQGLLLSSAYAPEDTISSPGRVASDGADVRPIENTA